MNQAGQNINLPDKLYFRIGEVSDIVGVKPYVLRYWETEFTDIKPSKSKSGQRLYKRRDVESLLKIRELLYDKRYTIDGAKQRLKEADHVVQTVVREEAVKPGEQMAFGVIAAEKPAKVEISPASREAVSVDHKFLEKIKSDLEWCVKELKAG